MVMSQNEINSDMKCKQNLLLMKNAWHTARLSPVRPRFPRKGSMHDLALQNISKLSNIYQKLVNDRTKLF